MSAQLATGIDVALYQKAIDWTKVKASGQTFAFIKATQGQAITDPYFAANWSQAKAAGLPRGAYHFYENDGDGLAQAQRFVAVIGSDHGELPPVVDVEDPNGTANINDLKGCLDTIEVALGRKPIIYTANWYWNPTRWGGPVAWARQYDLWVATYNAANPVVPSDWTSWRFWQTSMGAVAGIAAAVDVDVFNGSGDDLLAWLQAKPKPGPLHTVPNVANQVVINAFFQAFGQNYWDKVVSADLTAMAVPRTNRTLTYSGPAIEDLPGLTAADKAALIAALTQMPPA